MTKRIVATTVTTLAARDRFKNRDCEVYLSCWSGNGSTWVSPWRPR